MTCTELGLILWGLCDLTEGLALALDLGGRIGLGGSSHGDGLCPGGRGGGGSAGKPWWLYILRFL